MMARIIVRVVIFGAKRTDCRHLRDVFAGLRPMKVPSLARQSDGTPWWIGLHLVTVEAFTEPNVEDAGHDCVDAIFRVLVRHQLCAVRHLHPDHVRAGFSRMAYEDRQASPSRKRREWLPVDVFGQDYSKISPIRLMIVGHWPDPSLVNANLQSGD